MLQGRHAACIHVEYVGKRTDEKTSRRFAKPSDAHPRSSGNGPTYCSARTNFSAKGGNMPIDHSGNGYLATDAGILVDAFEGALKALRLVDRNDPAALVVANHIITFAKTGVLDPVRLRDLTLEAVRIAAPVTDRLASRNSGPPLWVINLVCGARLLATEPDHAHQVLPLQ